LQKVPHPDLIRDRLQELYAEARQLRRLLPIAETVHERELRARAVHQQEGLCRCSNS
jgi:hypothetical protein